MEEVAKEGGNRVDEIEAVTPTTITTRLTAPPVRQAVRPLAPGRRRSHEGQGLGRPGRLGVAPSRSEIAGRTASSSSEVVNASATGLRRIRLLVAGALSEATRAIGAADLPAFGPMPMGTADGRSRRLRLRRPSKTCFVRQGRRGAIAPVGPHVGLGLTVEVGETTPRRTVACKRRRRRNSKVTKVATKATSVGPLAVPTTRVVPRISQAKAKTFAFGVRQGSCP